MRDMHQVGSANLPALTISSLWRSPANMPASHAGDHRSEAGQGRHLLSARGSRGIADPPDSESGSLGRASRLAPTNFNALKAFPVMHSLGRRANSVQFRVRAPFRNRASAQAGFISQLRRGQHSGLRPFTSTQQPADFFCKEFLSGQHRLEDPVPFPFRASGSEGIEDPADRESASLGGASPLSPTIHGVEATADRHRIFNPVW